MVNLELSSQTLVETFKLFRNERKSFFNSLIWYVIITHALNFEFRITKIFESSILLLGYLSLLNSFVINENHFVSPLYDS